MDKLGSDTGNPVEYSVIGRWIGEEYGKYFDIDGGRELDQMWQDSFPGETHKIDM